MTTILLNVGLEVNDGARVYNNKITRVVEVIEAWLPTDVSIERFVRVESQTEPTLLVQLDGGPLFDVDDVYIFAHRVAQYLRQDCIAVYFPGTNHGVLRGPQAAKWGSFNPECFILEDGVTLAASLKQEG